MSLPEALEALEQIAGAALPRWSTYRGAPVHVALPAVVVQLPEVVNLNQTANGRARYQVPVTFAVAPGDAIELAEVMANDGPVVRALDGAEHAAWHGMAQVTEVGDLRQVDDAGVPCIAVDVTVIVYC